MNLLATLFLGSCAILIVVSAVNTVRSWWACQQMEGKWWNE